MLGRQVRTGGHRRRGVGARFAMAIMKTYPWRYLLVVGVVLAAFVAASPSGAKRKGKKAKAPQTVADLQIVDCLLPGQVRRLGRFNTYVTPRQPVRVTAFECRVRGGDYVELDRADHATALAVWLEQAKTGDPEAQTMVGEIFEKGLAETPDYEAAATWYRRAADEGFATAQINLGHLYEKGLGVPASSTEALRWYRRAAGLAGEIDLDLEQTLARQRELEERLLTTERSLSRARVELERTRVDVETLTADLEAARAAGEAARAEALARRVEAQQEQVAGRSTSVEELERSVRSYARELAQLSTEPLVARGPSIEIVEPNVLATRGPAFVAVPAGTERVGLVGRVEAPSGLDVLTVNDSPVSPRAGGFFEYEVDVVGVEAIVLRAVDRQGRTAEVVIRVGSSVARGEGPSSAPGTRLPAASPLGERYALIIHISDYQSFPALKTARNDAERIAAVLQTRYGYTTRMLADPSYFAILSALDELRQAAGEDDSVVIYYAGHGKIDEGSGRGYWLPIDAVPGDRSLWIPNEAISDYLSTFEARQVLLVADSCYAATLTDGSLPLGTGQDSGRGARTRTVLTSGGLQPVLDAGGGESSVFARALLNVLALNDGVLTGAALHGEVAPRVSYAASKLGFEQRPEYAPIRFAGHQSGDFVLARLD